MAGNAAFDAGIAIDNYILFEVLDLGGALIRAGVVGNGEEMRLNGTTVPLIGPASYTYAAGAIDITSLLPTDALFRLRVSSLDYGGDAFVSDVYLHPEVVTTPPPPPPPPPPPTDPFDPASCAGPKLTRDEALGFFAPASSQAWNVGDYTLSARARSCSHLTGCAAYRDASDAEFPVTQYTATSAREKLGGGPFNLWTQNGSLYTWTSHPHAELWCEWSSDPDVGCLYATPNHQSGKLMMGSNVVVGYLQHTPAMHITRSCFRLAMSTRIENTSDHDLYTDVEAVWLGHFNR